MKQQLLSALAGGWTDGPTPDAQGAEHDCVRVHPEDEADRAPDSIERKKATPLATNSRPSGQAL